VILVHGTGSTPEESFPFGYQAALPKLGIPVCTVRLPERGTVDQQRSIQYVVFAVREVHRRAGRKVSLLGHSQGALLATYAPQFYADLVPLIDDVVGLAGPYQGTQTANNDCADGSCSATSWQFRMGSDLNRAFMSGGRPAGISFTAVATQFDQLVTPAPDAARLDGATNVVIQDICPGRTVDHFAIVGDAVGYAIALDAFTNAGTADAARVDRASCAQTFPPGAEQEKFDPRSITNAVLGLTTAPQLDREPPLVCPFDPAACAAISGTPAPSGTSQRSPVRLTRTCVGAGRLRVRLAGDTARVRRVEFRFGTRVVARDATAPFSRVLSRRTLRRSGTTRLRAVAVTSAGSRVALARTLPSCGVRRSGGAARPTFAG
jgi:pimeloyl-ACP methyl ester carboxylesterase